MFGLTVIPGSPRMASGEIWTFLDEALGAEGLRVSFPVDDQPETIHPLQKHCATGPDDEKRNFNVPKGRYLSTGIRSH